MVRLAITSFSRGPSPLTAPLTSNPDWSRVLNSQQEIWAYLRRVAVKYDLVQRTSFSTLVESAAWHEASSRWRLILRDLRTDIRLVHETQFLFSGAGILVEPRPLDVPGVARFAGPLLHTARWPREGVDLAGRDVVLFGNGCTAVQVVSAVAPHVGRLTQFVRNKHWILPSIDDTTRRTLQFALKYVPGAAWLQRILVFLVAENALRGFYRTRLGEAFRRGKEETARRLVRKNAPPEYHDMLLPDFPIGCKRRIFDTGYLAALGRENITLTDEKVLEVVPEGVRTEKGIVKADIIISANGFVVNNFLGKMEIRGRGGRTIQEHWEEYGGPEAYNCSLLHDFPNFFMLLGQYTPPSLMNRDYTSQARLLTPLRQGPTRQLATLPASWPSRTLSTTLCAS